jgi:hypothetical protein
LRGSSGYRSPAESNEHLVRADDADAAADADKSIGCGDFRRAVVAHLAAYEPDETFCERRRQPTRIRLRVKHILVDGEIAVRTDRHRRLVDEEQLHGSRCSRLNSFAMRDRLADDDRARSALPAGLRGRIDGGRSSDVLRTRSRTARGNTCEHERDLQIV